MDIIDKNKLTEGLDADDLDLIDEILQELGVDQEEKENDDNSVSNSTEEPEESEEIEEEGSDEQSDPSSDTEEDGEPDFEDEEIQEAISKISNELDLLEETENEEENFDEENSEENNPQKTNFSTQSDTEEVAEDEEGLIPEPDLFSVGDLIYSPGGTGVITAISDDGITGVYFQVLIVEGEQKGVSCWYTSEEIAEILKVDLERLLARSKKPLKLYYPEEENYYQDHLSLHDFFPGFRIWYWYDGAYYRGTIYKVQRWRRMNMWFYIEFDTLTTSSKERGGINCAYHRPNHCLRISHKQAIGNFRLALNKALRTDVKRGDYVFFLPWNKLVEFYGTEEGHDNIIQGNPSMHRPRLSQQAWASSKKCVKVKTVYGDGTLRLEGHGALYHIGYFKTLTPYEQKELKAKIREQALKARRTQKEIEKQKAAIKKEKAKIKAKELAVKREKLQRVATRKRKERVKTNQYLKKKKAEYSSRFNKITYKKKIGERTNDQYLKTHNNSKWWDKIDDGRALRLRIEMALETQQTERDLCSETRYLLEEVAYQTQKEN